MKLTYILACLIALSGCRAEPPTGASRIERDRPHRAAPAQPIKTGPACDPAAPIRPGTSLCQNPDGTWSGVACCMPPLMARPEDETAN